MSCNVLLNLLNSLRKSDKMLGMPRILSLFLTNLINSIKHEHSCKILYLLRSARFDNGGHVISYHEFPNIDL